MAISPDTITESMASRDIRPAIRYLTVGAVAYLLLAVATGRGVRVLEVAVFLGGILALALVAERLGD